MDEQSNYEMRKRSAMKNLRNYLMFNTVFVLLNLIVIHMTPGYSFPKNFFALWPLIGWGAPTLFKFLELRRYR
ncbi:2TM domain-containing protein [uncultured Fretibacterium sp.]|uniref:2TM domain-containing protein n=1 Tax=uncultured Fretibacterium sp. TaxID=1678694 RepID=UPI0026101128|nr:2TM domain-containing protein [uncultured Fretibacterium sp.]